MNQTYDLTEAFGLNGNTYRTDAETLELLRVVASRAKANGDGSALFAMMHFGQKAGRILIEPTRTPSGWLSDGDEIQIGYQWHPVELRWVAYLVYWHNDTMMLGTKGDTVAAALDALADKAARGLRLRFGNWGDAYEVAPDGTRERVY